MELLIKTDFFKNLNIGFALDEGLANPGEEYMLYYSERLPWWIEVTVTGQPGHGSQFRFNKIQIKPFLRNEFSNNFSRIFLFVFTKILKYKLTIVYSKISW